MQFTTKQYVDNAIVAGGTDLTGYATEAYVDDAIETAIEAIPPVDLTGLATETYVNDAIAAIPPVDLSALATTTYVDDAIDTVMGSIPADVDLTPYFKKDGSVAATGAFNMNGHKITGLVNGVLPTDAMTRGYIDGQDEQLQLQIDALNDNEFVQADADARYLQLTGGSLSGALNMGLNKISGLAAATLGTDAVTKTQLDASFAGYDKTSTLDSRYYLNTVPLN